MHFRILGPLEILDDLGQPVELESPKLRAVVCRLLMDAGRVVPHEVLVASLWGDDPPPAADGTLQTYVSRLRRVLEPSRLPRTPARILVTRPPGYLIATDPTMLDADEFDRVVDAAGTALRSGRPEAAASLLSAGRSLWRGRPLADVADEPFAAAAVARLEQRQLSALELEIDAWLVLGRTGDAVAELESLIRQHPLHERYWAQLMTALYRSGRQSDALTAYATCRAMLRDELGLDPGPELQALERAVLDHDPSLSATAHQPPRPADASGPPARPAAETPASASLLSLTPDRWLVGREPERATLAEALRSARAGRGVLVTIEGEAGIGKTRLAEAAAEAAAEAGMVVAWTYCLDEMGAPPLWPWIDVRRSTAAAAADATSADPANDTPSTDPDADSALFGQLVSLVEDLVAAADRQPLLVVVDDLQWADQASLQLLRLLAGQIGSAALAVVLTVRRPDGGSNRMLDATLADLVRSPHHRRLRLHGLSADEAAELVTAISGRVDPPLAQTLLVRTGGNPFFLSESAKLIASEADDGDTTGELRRGGTVPDTVRDVVERRVQRLPDDTQAILRLASVSGPSVELAVLEHSTGLDADQVCALVEPAVDSGLVLEVDDDTFGWRFSHALVQDAVRSTLTGHTRARLHATLADALQSVHQQTLDQHLDELAHHSYEAARVSGADAAFRWSTAAARSAHQNRGHDRAAFHWGRAVILQGAMDATDVERYELLIALAEDLRLMGDLDGARARLEEAMRIARHLGDDERVARAAVVFGGVTLWYWRAYDQADWSMIDEGRRLAATASGSREVELLGTLGVELFYTDDRAEGIAAAERAVALARAMDDIPLLGRSLNNYALAAWDPEHDDIRLVAIEESLTHADRGLPLHTEVIARIHRAAVNLRRARIDAVEDDLARCHGLAAELAVPEMRAAVRYATGGLAMLRGEWGEAERLAREAFELQSRTSLWGAEWAMIMQLAPILSAQGRVAEVVDDARRIADLPGMDATRPLTVVAVAETGDIEEARRLAELWWDPARRSDWTTDHRTADWAAVATMVGYPDAAGMYERLQPYADRLVVAGTAVACRGSTHYLLGRLAATMGDVAAAARHFGRAQAVNEALGARWHATQARDSLAALGRHRQ